MGDGIIWVNLKNKPLVVKLNGKRKSGMVSSLSVDERATLLRVARQAITSAVVANKILPIELKEYSQHLLEISSSFVTLTIKGALRGCVGAIEAQSPLVVDVRDHAISAALHDYRFPPLRVDEIPEVSIEISRLTPPEPLFYEHAADLPKRIRSGVDGIVLRRGRDRATFLPQVWDKIPEPEDFISQLCLKMGLPANTWRDEIFVVSTYQVEEFHE